ncbi:hypothetical protein J437_LFUL014306 [Ladona fulva]|uniref:Uncharacterized protein n=1 Tax=Ladona fulva TaxID=123851 RepID=A0A8K0KT24_LADFU|nr:hypothetical protein J437_LFUL014306 [Ladona fulva]
MVKGGRHRSNNDSKVMCGVKGNELSKYTEAIPLKDQDASTVSQAFVTTTVLRFGIPQTILTD